MKYKFLIFCFLCTSLFAKDFSLDEAIQNFNWENSYEHNIYKLDSLETNIEINSNKLGDYKGINIDSSLSTINGESKNLHNKINFGNFFVNFNYNNANSSDSFKNNYLSFGIEKNIKDIFYSPYKSNLKRNNIKKNLNNLNYDKNIKNKKIELVNLYYDILNTKNTIKIKKLSQDYYEKEYKKVKDEYNLGLSPEINVEIVDVELKSLNLELKNLEEELKTLYKIAKINFNINFDEYSSLLPIKNDEDIKKLLENYSIDDIKILDLNLKIAEEIENYEKFNSLFPDLILSYERVKKNSNMDNFKEENLFSIKFSKKIFDDNKEYKLQKINKEKVLLELNEKKKNINLEKDKILNEYNEIKNSLEIANYKQELANKKYKIKNKEYELGKISYSDMLDAFNEFMKQKLEAENLENKLNSFKYKIAINN